MQKMPTGHFVRRKKEDGFKRQAPRRYECMAINWLEWEAKNTGQHIRHQGNDSEKLIGMKRLPVDGFCRDTNTVYEFQGCIWHGHVHDGGQYLVLCHGDQTITRSFSMFDKTTQFRASFDTG
jgi:hypothetical protein